MESKKKTWGTYYVLDEYTTPDNVQVKTKRLHIDAGKNISYQFHKNRSEVWTIISGNGVIVIDDVVKYIYPGATYYINKRENHCIKADTDVIAIEVQYGKECSEDDIVRIETDWEKIYNKYAL